MLPAEVENPRLLLGVGICAGPQHGGLPILTYPKEKVISLEWELVCEAAAGVAESTSVGIIHLQSCVLGYQTSQYGYVLLLVGAPSCPHSVLRIKMAELLNLADLLLGQTLSRTFTLAQTRVALQPRLPHESDILQVRTHTHKFALQVLGAGGQKGPLPLPLAFKSVATSSKAQSTTTRCLQMH